MRDPRRDPQVGDVVYKVSSLRRVIEIRNPGRYANEVLFVDHTGKAGRITLKSWRSWCKGSTLEPISAPTSEDQGLRIRFVELENRVVNAERLLIATSDRVMWLERMIGSGEGIGIDTL